MAIGDIVRNVFDEVLAEILKKVTGPTKRTRRKRTPTAAERLKKIEALLKPARQQTSRKKTTRTRSAPQQKRVATRTQAHKRSLRRGKAVR